MLNKVSQKLFWGWIASLGFMSLSLGVVISQPLKDLPPQTGGRSGGTKELQHKASDRISSVNRAETPGTKCF